MHLHRLLTAGAVLFAGLCAVARGNLIQMPISGVGPVAQTTFWDAANKGAGITLTGTGPDIASSNTTSWASVRSTVSKASGTGKVYFEIGCNTISSDGDMAGLENSSGSLTSYAGSTANGIGFQMAPGTTETIWYINGASTHLSGTYCSSGTANRVHFAFDIDAAGGAKIWFQPYAAGTGDGKWNNVAQAQPTTGGISVTFSGPYFIAWSGINNPGVNTGQIYTAASTVQGPIPTGYTVWDDAGAATVPVVTAAPAVTPTTASVSTVLTSTTGTWTNSPTSYGYQWKSGSTNVGTNVNTYTVASGDAGASITSNVTATNAGGNSTPAASNAVSIPGGGGVNWSTSDKDSTVAVTTTTNTNDTATKSSGAAWAMVRGNTSYATGTANKKILKFKVQQIPSGTANWMGGLADGSVSTAGFPGQASHGLGIQAANGATTNTYQDANGGSPTGCANGSSGIFSTAGGGGITPNGYMWLAINFNNGHVFCSPDCGTWINSANPDADTGSQITLSTATYKPAWAGYYSGGNVAVIIDTNPSLAGCTNISGFSAWG